MYIELFKSSFGKWTSGGGSEHDLHFWVGEALSQQTFICWAGFDLHPRHQLHNVLHNRNSTFPLSWNTPPGGNRAQGGYAAWRNTAISMKNHRHNAAYVKRNKQQQKPKQPPICFENIDNLVFFNKGIILVCSLWIYSILDTQISKLKHTTKQPN